MTLVVIVEDEPSVAANLKFALQREGFTTLWAPTGAEALRLVTAETSLVLLDIGLPDQSGFEIAKQLRQLFPVPILFLTARTEDADVVQAFELNACDYVTKPFSLVALMARVKNHLKTISTQRPLSRCPLAIDEERKQIVFFGMSIVVTKCEFEIAKVLTSRPGWVFTRQQLLDRIWAEEDHASTDRAVDTHIKTLRRKLDAVRQGSTAIQTHRGFGYSLRDDW